ncbi:3'-5' exonuclease [Limosilactobacillus sp.]|uniref:3'-5' exonuclease n=1 Tax=Limosilactobacillus sp. TaxID=2773925 RepID=UPI003F01E24A
MNFIVMDFETANGKRYSACSLALTIVRNSQIADEFYTLINPQTDFFWRNIQVHGIHKQDVINAPTFPTVWEHIKEFYTPEKLVVAHNNRFDNSVLKSTLEHYGIEPPAYLTLDTLASSRQLLPGLSNYKLNTVCDALNVDLHHHHNALDDAQACANILLTQGRQFGSQRLRPFIKMVG